MALSLLVSFWFMIFAFLVSKFFLVQYLVDIYAEKHSPVNKLHVQEQKKSRWIDDNLRRNRYHDRAQGDICAEQYAHLNSNQTPGISHESLARSLAWPGNTERLYHFTKALYSSNNNKRPLTILICGGSITLGWGVVDQKNNRYSAILQSWLRSNFPGVDHKIINAGAHGADMCSLSKRIRLLLDTMPNPPDLVLLEFGVNDYQGQDDISGVDHKTSVFFDGFRDIAACAEVVIYTLLHSLPETSAIMFLELRTAILGRKTAQLLHMGVAEHYQIPVISYSEAMIPEYLHLINLLSTGPRNTYSFNPKNSTKFKYKINGKKKKSYMLPYPYGCSSCKVQDLSDYARSGKCKSICIWMRRSGFECQELNRPVEYVPCYVPIFGPDEVHATKVGHAIITDLIIHAITRVGRDYVCNDSTFMKHILPTTGWIVGSTRSLRAQGNFMLVNDTMMMGTYAQHNDLKPVSHTNGWEFYSDTEVNEKFGWIATEKRGGEIIVFDINLPHKISSSASNTEATDSKSCYVIYVAILRSYAGMGKFTVTVSDAITEKITSLDVDGQWEAHISVWSDIQVTNDNDKSACTGRCQVQIKTHPEIPGRTGNKVKLYTLSVRQCEE